MKKLALTTAILLLAAAGALAAEPAPTAPAPPATPQARTEPGVGLTIYSEPARTDGGGYMYAEQQMRQQEFYPRQQRDWYGRPGVRPPGWGVVKEWRKLALPKGEGEVRFTDVAEFIDPTTVKFSSLADPAGTTVLDQDYRFDLAGAQQILERYLDRPITVQTKGQQTEGQLLSFANGLVLRQADGTVVTLPWNKDLRRILLPGLPGGLLTKPTLVWKTESEKGGEQLCQITYQTRGLTWRADYTLLVSPDVTTAGLAGWVTLENRSGAGYRDAELKLVAGDVNRLPEVEEVLPFGTRLGIANAPMATGAPQFVEQAFFEYHLYALQRRTALPDNSVKQIELFPPAAGVPLRREYTYRGAAGVQPWRYQNVQHDQNFGVELGNRQVDVDLVFKNSKENHLGMPLPAGRVRVMLADPADGEPEMVGEEWIDHTPKDEELRLRLGSTFDILGQRKQTNFQIDYRLHRIEEAFEIRLRNHKAEPVTVRVVEPLYRGANWEILLSSVPFTKTDAWTGEFSLPIPADGEATLVYTVRYTW